MDQLKQLVSDPQNGVLIATTFLLGAAIVFVLFRRPEKKGKELRIPFNDLKPGEMKEIEHDDQKVLVVKTSDSGVYAVSPKCTHYAVSLCKGVLQDNRVICPAHGACFNVKTGDIEDAPAIDGLHTFPTRVSGGEIVVSLPETAPKKGREPHVCTGKPDARTFVILGAGAAGAVAAETLRQEGFAGHIVVVGNEEHLPYDRVKLSKNLAVTADQLLLRSADFYKKHRIEVRTSTTCVGVDTAKKLVKLAPTSNQTAAPEDLAYDSLLIATGGYPRTITQAPGHDLKGIYTLRVPEDANAINASCEGAKTVVIVGSSFIGMEAAACLKQSKNIEKIHIVGMEKVPFERVLGPEIGAIMQKVHESKGGVTFHMQRVVKQFHGTKGKVTAVELDNGENIPCDFCVVGAGIICGTQYLKDSGLTLERDGSIVVNASLRVANNPSVFVAGDIARFPYWATNETIRIEHWDVAMQQGKVAAKNMAGKTASFETVPFFWTTQFGLGLRYAGNNMNPDEIHVINVPGANPEAPPAFVAYYSTKGEVTAVATLNSDPVAVAASELIRQRKMPSLAVLKTKPHTYLHSLTKPI